MKKLKRILAVVLSMTLILSMCVSAVADDTTYSIVVSNTARDYTYTAYQIFTGTLGTDNGSTVLKKTDWSDDITESDALYEALAAIVDADDGSYPFTQDKTATGDPWYSAQTVAAALSGYDNDSEVVQKFAEVVAAYLVANPAVQVVSTQSEYNDKYLYTFSGLSAGYYLIMTTGLPTNENGDEGAYTRYILAMTGATEGSSGDNAIESKSDLPQLDKDLDKNDANINDTVTYYLTASLPSDYSYYTTYNLTFHDTLCSGLDFDEVLAVYVYDSDDRDTNETNAADQLTANATECTSGYTVNTSTTDGCSFEVTLNAKDFTTNSNALIQVVFTATLNDDAIIGGAGNPNEAYLEYSNNMYSDDTGKTVTDKVITWTYELDVTKVDGEDNSVTLPGAEFKLYRVNDNGDNEYVVVDSANKVSSWVTDKDSASTLTSDASGLFSVIGLDVGTYYITETKAPVGYNVLSADIEIEVTATHTSAESGTWLTDDKTALDSLVITYNSTDHDGTVSDGKVSLPIENNSGATLPSTGGIGTTIFYIVGGILVVGAIILLITKRRMGGDDK